MNGEYAPPDEIAYASEESENHLTDYSLGEHGVYCAFSYKVSDEALEYVKSIADEYMVGVYDIQSNDAIFGKGIEILKYRTEHHDDTVCDWDNIEQSIDTLTVQKEEQAIEKMPSSQCGLIRTKRITIIFNAHRTMSLMDCLEDCFKKTNLTMYPAIFLKLPRITAYIAPLLRIRMT